MNYLDRFADYAAAFEETFVDNNWARIEQYFTEDAVYAPGDGTEAIGRDNVFRTLQGSIDGLDRRFDTRVFGDTPVPTVDGNVVTLIWSLTFSKVGVPDLTISGRELATFNGVAIERLEDIMDDGVIDTMGQWMQEHGGSI